MNTVNIKSPSLPTLQKNKNEQAKSAVDSFLNTIRGIGYQKEDIITMIKEELK